jgi:hypothetical protein
VAFDPDHPLQDLADATDAWFTAKRKRRDPDERAVFQKTLGAGIVVIDATHAEITLDPDDTDAVGSSGEVLFADLQGSPPVTTVWSGLIEVEPDVTRDND